MCSPQKANPSIDRRPCRHRRSEATERPAPKVSGTPSRGSAPSSENRCTNRCVPACLTDTFRSQGFSPSQRLEPRAPLRFCFTPHPLVGFLTFRAFPTKPAGAPKKVLHTLMPFETHQVTRRGRGNTTHHPMNEANPLATEPYADQASDTPRDEKRLSKPLLSWPSSS
jgi:hypothetical protein